MIRFTMLMLISAVLKSEILWHSTIPNTRMNDWCQRHTPNLYSNLWVSNTWNKRWEFLSKMWEPNHHLHFVLRAPFKSMRQS